MGREEEAGERVLGGGFLRMEPKIGVGEWMTAAPVVGLLGNQLRACHCRADWPNLNAHQKATQGSQRG